MLVTNSNGSDHNKNDIALKIERLYVKEISCKIPHAPGLFETVEFKESMGEMSPSIEISTKIQTVAENKYEVVLHAIVNGKAKNVSLFVLEVQQAGIFTVNAPASQLKQIIESNCASFLHAYLSQAISHAIIQAGFPPIVLQPSQPIINQGKVQEQFNTASPMETVKAHVEGSLERVIKIN